MTDVETAIIIKNMARAMVRAKMATVKNGTGNVEIRNGNKALQKISDMMFYGQYYKEPGQERFQVLDSKPFSEIAWKNWIKKYGFVGIVAKVQNADFTKTKDAEKMGAYKETAVDKQKKNVDFLIKSMNGSTVTIDWKNGKRETVSKKDLEKLKQGHSWATDF